MRKIIRNVIIALLALPLALFCAPTAQGFNKPMTELDRSSYEDGSVYDNPPADFSVLRVGLVFKNEAVQRAEFISRSETGFLLGQFDSDREFKTELETDVKSITVSAANGVITAVNSDNGELLCTVNGQRLALKPASDSRNALTEYGGRHYRGGFECLSDGSRLSVINYVGLEDYVKGVVPYEMSASWGIEALKAQAVCARTYAVHNRGEYEEFGFDIRDDTYSQVYNGVLEATENSDNAVDCTAGQLIRYKGEVCEIYYFAADGGATEDGANVFDTDKPYLRGRYDPFEKAVDFSMKDWTSHRSGAEIGQALREKGFEIGDVVRIEPKRSHTGNVIRLSFFDAGGACARLEGRSCYNLLRLNSCRFRVETKDDGFDFVGHGWGHSCGMSQWGAKAMAEVYGYNYEDIIRFYFTGAYIA